MIRSTVVAGAAVAILLYAYGSDTASAREDCDAVAQSVRGKIASACPCDTAETRGDYIRCVRRKLDELSKCTKNAEGGKECGPVPRQCVGKIGRTASSSTCGKPDLVTCCLPRHQDCRNDPHPNDGNAEGKCVGTTKACDKIEDCVIPKCQPYPDADRCVQAGGTVGKGGDCATACAF